MEYTSRKIAREPQKKKKETKGAAVKGGLLIVLFVVGILGYYYFLTNREKEVQESNPQMTAVQEVLSRDLYFNYPPSPREVIKYYSEITQCFYNEEYTDEELERLAIKARDLYDEELLEGNDWSKYIMDLEEDIALFKATGTRISSYTVASSTSVDEFPYEEHKFARIYCCYTLVTGEVKQRVEEIFLLRKDENSQWKIYGWDLAENVKLEEK